MNNLLEAGLDQYINENSTPEPTLLQELWRETHLKCFMPHMASGWQQGLFLEMITRMLKPKRILEIGTFTGYSTVCFALGMPADCEIDTIEVNPELEIISKKYFEKSGRGADIHQHFGNAIELIPNLNFSYDLVFIDADKTSYSNYLNLVYDKVPSGGVILADNVLWSGKVADESVSDKDTQNMRNFNKEVLQNKGTDNLIVSIRDGINLIFKN